MRSAISYVPPAFLSRLLTIALTAASLAAIPASGRSAVQRRDHDSTRGEGFEYVSPRPGSRLVSRWNNIAFRQGSEIEASSVASARVSVAGASSGRHGGALALSDDGRTIVFRPQEPFARGEVVDVEVHGGIRTRAGEEIPSLTFQFTVAGADPREPWDPALAAALSDEVPTDRPPDAGLPAAPEQGATTSACGALPSSFPSLQLLLSDHPEPGYVFVSPFRSGFEGHLVILDDRANPIFYRQIPMPAIDFKVQPDGRITYFSQTSVTAEGKFYALDASYAVVDSFQTGNGYHTDTHDLQLLPDGHALLMSYDPQPVRMDLVVSGGKANATVIGLIVQELDASKNVVFQWRSWDHFQITDATSPLAGLTSFLVDYVHGNSVELDRDGDLLLSSRHLSEITKISRQTGAVLWRMGPHASRNQFAFPNDPRGFSHQHDARRLPNGHITLFDNGNLLSPVYSRALEYEIDEVAKSATLVWEHRNQPDTYGAFMGNVQRRAGGGTMIGWGGADGPRLTDLHADGTKAFELGMAGGTWTYRAFRFPWRTNRFVTDRTSLDFGEIRIGDPAALAVSVRNPFPEPITIDCTQVTDAAFTVVTPMPLSLAPGGTAQVEIRFQPLIAAAHAARLYLRSTGASELIAQDVELSGTGVTNRPPDCRPARPVPEVLWPPNHELMPVAIEGVADPDGDPVTIEITSVTQDEAIRGAGILACSDASVEIGSVLLRAERDGSGSGRVYQIGFIARDPSGAQAQGVVRVCVPHDRGAATGDGVLQADADACEDEGQTVSSLGKCAESGQPDRARGVPPSRAAGAERSERGSVWVEFTLPVGCVARPALYDLAGRRVAELGSEWRGAGSQRVVWSTAGLAAGMYFCRIGAGPAVITRPILVLR